MSTLGRALGSAVSSVGLAVFEIYDESESPKEGGVFKMYRERSSPNAGAW